MRLEVSRRTDIALRALRHLHSLGPSNGSALSASVGTTLNYLPHLLKPLVTHGWIVGTPGPGGGYELNVDVADVSILDVIEAMEGRTEDKECVLRDVPCPAVEPCVMHDSWQRARDALLAELDATSVATTLASAPTKGE